MTLIDSMELMKKYAKCPKCGNEAIGSGNGTFECDTEKGYFKRVCRCGWRIEIKEEAK